MRIETEKKGSNLADWFHVNEQDVRSHKGGECNRIGQEQHTVLILLYIRSRKKLNGPVHDKTKAEKLARQK